MQGKRGLSAVVTTLLIILLSLVAVGGIWVVVNNFIQIGSEQIELGKFTLDLKIQSVRIQGDSDVTVTVVVRRTGKGDLIGMNFIFSDGQNSEVIRRDTTLEELDVETFVFTLAEISTSNLEDVSVAPIYELISGKEEPGNVADMFDIKKGVGITGGVVDEGPSNFEALGYEGVGKREYGPFVETPLEFPEFKLAIVDPIDVLPGDNQTFTVELYSPNDIVSVTSITELDNSVLDLDFEKIGEYPDNNNEIIEIWTITWNVTDVHTTTYRTTITAIDSGGNENSIELTWTDACQSQISFSDHGSTKTLSSTCTTGNTIGGLDGGNLIVGTNVHLTIDAGATWAFSSGNTITLQSGASITVDGQIKKGNLYYTDSDGDGYALGTTLTFGSGGTLARNIVGVNDCEDGGSGAFIFRTVSSLGFSTMGGDFDHDGYTGSSLGSGGCVGAGPTLINGRNYYKSLLNDDVWMDWSLRLGSDVNDADASCYRNRYFDFDLDGVGAGNLICVADQGGYSDTNTDCNDGDADVYRNIGSLSTDIDRDGYILGTASGTQCVGATGAAWFARTYYKATSGLFTWLVNADKLGTNDCNDASTAYYPGNPTWYTDRPGNDHNCDSVITKEFPAGVVGQCWSCSPDEKKGSCNTDTTGVIGWIVDNACGETHTYVSNAGTACSSRTAESCLPSQQSCSSASKQQRCR